MDLSEEKFIEIVNKVADNHANKTFDYHTPADIKQQVWIIALEKIEQFKLDKSKHGKDIAKSLEHWLNAVVSNRLKNFYRDNFGYVQKDFKSDKSPADKQKRINLKFPIEIHPDLGITEEFDYFETLEEKIDISEFTLYHMEIYDSILSGVKTTCYYRNKLIEKVESIWQQDADQ